MTHISLPPTAASVPGRAAKQAIRARTVAAAACILACAITAEPAKAELPRMRSDFTASSPDALARESFERFDADRDRFVSEDEYARAGISVFTELDKNRDDVLERSELSEWDGSTTDADSDRDGSLSFREAMSAQSGKFSDVDRNSDKLLSFDEVLSDIESRQQLAR